MSKNNRFTQGERVNGISLTGKKVFGEYRGMRPSFGAYIYGLQEGSTELGLHVCLALTLERPKIKHNKPGRPAKYKTDLKAGDACTANTKTGLLITGKFQNQVGEFAFVRGWKEGDNRLSLPEAYKVLTNTLKKV